MSAGSSKLKVACQNNNVMVCNKQTRPCKIIVVGNSHQWAGNVLDYIIVHLFTVFYLKSCLTSTLMGMANHFNHLLNIGLDNVHAAMIISQFILNEGFVITASETDA